MIGVGAETCNFNTGLRIGYESSSVYLIMDRVKGGASVARVR